MPVPSPARLALADLLPTRPSSVGGEIQPLAAVPPRPREASWKGPWDECKRALAAQLNAAEVEGWLRHLCLLALTRERIVLGGFPNALTAKHVRERHLCLLQTALQKHLAPWLGAPQNGGIRGKQGKPRTPRLEIQFCLGQPSSKPSPATRDGDQSLALERSAISPEGRLLEHRVQEDRQQLELRLEAKRAMPLADSPPSTWRQRAFHPHSAAERAWTCAQAVLARPGRHTPLVFVGPPGTGKTHLQEEIIRRWRENNPQRPRLQLHGQRFCSEVIEAFAKKRIEGLRKTIHSLGLLAIDELDFCTRSEAVQEELSRYIELLARRGGQTLVTMRGNPAQLKGLIPSLRARLESGIIVPLQTTLEHADRRALVQHCAASHGVELPEALVELIAQRVQSSPGALRGAVNSLLTQAGGEVARIDDAFASAVLAVYQGEATAPSEPAPSSSEPLLKAICAHFGVSLEGVLSRQRQQKLLLVRSVGIHLLRCLHARSYPEIGRLLGGRKHMTVLQNHRRFEKRLRNEPHTRRSLEIFCQQHGLALPSAETTPPLTQAARSTNLEDGLRGATEPLTTPQRQAI